jgi:hypothetical protein
MNSENPAPHEEHGDQIVCPKCLHHNEPEAAFCTECGAPIGMVANVDPMQQIYSEGFGFRSAVDGPPKRIILIGTWLVFLPLIGIALVGMKAGGFQTLSMLLLLLISIGILYRVTRNYLVKSREARKQ